VVGEIEDCVSDFKRSDLAATFPVHHDLRAARVNVYHCDMVGPEQCPAFSFGAGDVVIRFTFAHGVSTALRLVSA
jgi:hypothetical protein